MQPVHERKTGQIVHRQDEALTERSNIQRVGEEIAVIFLECEET